MSVSNSVPNSTTVMGTPLEYACTNRIVENGENVGYIFARIDYSSGSPKISERKDDVFIVDRIVMRGMLENGFKFTNVKLSADRKILVDTGSVKDIPYVDTVEMSFHIKKTVIYDRYIAKLNCADALTIKKVSIEQFDAIVAKAALMRLKYVFMNRFQDIIAIEVGNEIQLISYKDMIFDTSAHSYSSNISNRTGFFEGTLFQKIVINDCTVSFDISNMFHNCQAKVIDIRGLKLEEVRNTYGAFAGVQANILGLENIDFSMVVTACEMFARSEIDKIDASKWNMKNLDSVQSMFESTRCNNLIIGEHPEAQIGVAERMFFNSVIDNIDISKVHFTDDCSIKEMFSGTISKCVNASNIKLSSTTRKYDPSYGGTKRVCVDYGVFRKAHIDKLILLNTEIETTGTDEKLNRKLMTEFFEMKKQPEIYINTEQMAKIYKVWLKILAKSGESIEKYKLHIEVENKWNLFAHRK